MDARDETTWLILELSSQGESAAEDGTLETIIREQGDLTSDNQVFVPCLAYNHKGSRAVLSVMEGYAFVSSDVGDMFYQRIRSSPYIRRVLTRGTGVRKVAETIPDTNIRDLKSRLNEMVGAEITEDMVVRVVDGPLVGIVGKVVVIDGDQASVLVEMRSLYAVKDFPRFYLHPVNDDE